MQNKTEKSKLRDLSIESAHSNDKKNRKLPWLKQKNRSESRLKNKIRDSQKTSLRNKFMYIKIKGRSNFSTCEKNDEENKVSVLQEKRTLPRLSDIPGKYTSEKSQYSL